MCEWGFGGEGVVAADGIAQEKKHITLIQETSSNYAKSNQRRVAPNKKPVTQSAKQMISRRCILLTNERNVLWAL